MEFSHELKDFCFAHLDDGDDDLFAHFSATNMGDFRAFSRMPQKSVLKLRASGLPVFCNGYFGLTFSRLYGFFIYRTVFLSAWIGGLLLGLAPMFISVIFVWRFFMPPQFTLGSKIPLPIAACP